MKTELAPRLLPLVGRQQALAGLRAALERAERGERQVVFVTGAAGMGKTALVERFLRRVVAERRAVVAWGQCVEQHGAGEAFLPFLDALARLGLSRAGRRLRPVLERHAPLWLAQLPSLLAAGEAEPLVRSLAGASQERMLREMAEALEVLSREATLIVCIDDLHWSDPSSVDLVALLAHRIERARLLLLLTCRTPEMLGAGSPLRDVQQDLVARRLCQQLPLQMLAEDDVAEYLRDRLAGAAVDPAATAWVYARSEGHPLFLANLVDYLLQRGWLDDARAEGVWRLALPDSEREGAVPEGLAALIERQLASISNEGRELLEAASVAGGAFSALAVAAALQAEVHDVEQQLDGLARAGRLIAENGVEEWPDGRISGRYRFLHAFYRDAVLQKTGAARRVRLHRLIGGAQEQAWTGRTREIAGELAVHFAEGRDARRAILYALEAGNSALAHGAHREAVRHLRSGIARVADLPASPEQPRERAEMALQTALGAALITEHGYSGPEVVAAFERARELSAKLPRKAGTAAQLAPVLGGLSYFFHTRAELASAETLGRQFEEIAHATQDPLALCKLGMALGAPRHSAGRLLPALERFAAGLETYDPAAHVGHVSTYGGGSPGVGCLQWTALALWQLGYPEQSLRASRCGLALARHLAHPFSLIWVHTTSALIHWFRGEDEPAWTEAEAAVALASEEHLPFLKGVAVVTRACILADRLPPERAVAELEQSLATYEATGARLMWSNCRGALAAAHARAGDLTKALAEVEHALARVEANGERLYEPELARLKGRLLERAGHADTAEIAACYRRAHDRAQEMGAIFWQLRAALELARLHDAGGDRAAAVAILAPVVAVCDPRQQRSRELERALDLLAAWDCSGAPLSCAPAATNRPPQALLGRIARALDSVAERIGRAGSDSAGAMPATTRPPAAGNAAASTPAQPAAAPVAGVAAEASLLREGEYWTLVFAGETCRLRHSQGLLQLARLLESPGRSIAALDLAAMAEAPSPVAMLSASELPTRSEMPYGDTGELLDRRARREYEARLRELRDELEEAEARNDPGRAERAREEMEILLGELSRATGLGGRPRVGGSAAERARVNVTRTLRGVLRKIALHHAAAGRHLDVSVRTGTHCSYAPRGEPAPRWRL